MERVSGHTAHLVMWHPDRMGTPYRFPHWCPGFRVCAIRRYVYRRRHLGERRVLVHRVTRAKILDGRAVTRVE